MRRGTALGARDAEPAVTAISVSRSGAAHSALAAKLTIPTIPAVARTVTRFTLASADSRTNLEAKINFG